MLNHKKYCFLLIAFTLSIFVSAITDDGENKIVEIESGKIKGKIGNTHFEDLAYYAFLGIPYAKPPVKSLRFKAPQKVLPWTHVLDTLEYRYACPQVDPSGTVYTGNEDCLHLNVFTPVTETNDEKFPVMVFIHGGAYYAGSSEPYKPDFLLNEGVILVTINYRLGPFGFLSLGTAEYSGNMGLKDQRMAIKWVNENIEYFGGDKSSITIFGESSGASSVHHHIISPESKGLFKRAIAQSGSILNNWAFYKKADHLELLRETALNDGIEENELDVIEYIQEESAEQLVKKTFVPFHKPGSADKFLELPFAPLVEVPNAIDPFLTIDPETLMTNKKYTNDFDTMFGFCSHEMNKALVDEYRDLKLAKPFDDKFAIHLPLERNTRDFDSDEYKTIANKIRTFYFGKNGRITNSTFPGYIDLLSDLGFIVGIDAAVEFQSAQSTGNTFYYKFSMDTKVNVVKFYLGIKELPGASHADDLGYIFLFDAALVISNFFYSIKKDSAEHHYIQFVSKLWTDFAKNGTPSNDVNPIKDNVINYFDITNDGIVPGTNPNQERIQFWTEIFKEYNNEPLFHTGKPKANVKIEL